MEELDMIRRARQYLEALSSGTDPIGKKPIPQGETLLQPRLSRCFRYVAELLGEFEREPSLLEHLCPKPELPYRKGNGKSFPQDFFPAISRSARKKRRQEG